MFNFNHLYYFYVTAHLQGVTKAAAELRISQPSLSSQLKTLEQRFGRLLFHRRGRRFELTHDGKIVYDHCRRMFQVSDELSRWLRDGQADSTFVSCAVSDEIERPFAAQLISSVLVNHKNDAPSIVVNLKTESQNDLIEQLAKRRVDVALTNYPSLREDLYTLAAVKMPIMAACGTSLWKGWKSRKISGNTPLSQLFAEIRPALSVPSTGLKLRLEIDSYFESLGLRSRIAFESNALASVVRSVGDGVGLSFLPYPYIAREVNLGQIVTIGKKPLWYHDLYLVCHKDFVRAPPAQELRGSFIEVCKSLNCQVAHVSQ